MTVETKIFPINCTKLLLRSNSTVHKQFYQSMYLLITLFERNCKATLEQSITISKESKYTFY